VSYASPRRPPGVEPLQLEVHVKTKHPAHAIQFEERIKGGFSCGKHRQSFGSSASSRSNSQSSQPPAKEKRQPTIGEAFGQAAAGTGVRQSVVDTRIVDLFVCNMLPLQVVESPTFVSLIKMLNPNKTSMSRPTLVKRILASHKQLEECYDTFRSTVEVCCGSLYCYITSLEINSLFIPSN
jgi:hypothetical protein